MRLFLILLLMPMAFAQKVGVSPDLIEFVDGQAVVTLVNPSPDLLNYRLEDIEDSISANSQRR